MKAQDPGDIKVIEAFEFAAKVEIRKADDITESHRVGR